MPAAGFTKALPRQRHETFLKQLNLIDIHGLSPQQARRPLPHLQLSQVSPQDDEIGQRGRQEDEYSLKQALRLLPPHQTERVNFIPAKTSLLQTSIVGWFFNQSDVLAAHAIGLPSRQLA